MKPTSFENAIRLQFDTLMKKVIDGIIKNYEKELDRRSNREIPFCELPKIVVNSFPVFDDYELDITIFDVYGMEARVSGNELCKALQQLPKPSFLSRFKDLSIYKNLLTTTDFYRRTSLLFFDN